MGVMLASLVGFYAWGQNIANILQEWEYMGIFEFVLPFLLVFAVVFGILMSVNVLGKNRGINMVIALAVGLLAITSYEFRSFVRTLFPYAGIGVAILLVILILAGLFVKTDEGPGKWIFFGVSLFIAVVVILYALSSYNLFVGGWWWYEYGTAIITGAIIIGLILVVVFATKNEGATTTRHHNNT